MQRDQKNLQHQIGLMVYEEGEFQGAVLLPQVYEAALHASNEAMLLNEWAEKAPWPVEIYVILGPAKRFDHLKDKQISLKHYWPDWEDHWPL